MCMKDRCKHWAAPSAIDKYTWVCEGEVSQVLPSCCCQTVHPVLLNIDLTVQYTAIQNSCLHCTGNLLALVNSHTVYNYMLILYNIMFICIYKTIIFLIFLIILFIFYHSYCFGLFVCFVTFCPLAAVANKCPCLWDNKEMLILILILKN